MLMFRLDVTMKRLIKTINFIDSFERQFIYIRCTFIFKTLQDVFILKMFSFSKIQNRGPLRQHPWRLPRGLQFLVQQLVWFTEYGSENTGGSSLTTWNCFQAEHSGEEASKGSLSIAREGLTML